MISAMTYKIEPTSWRSPRLQLPIPRRLKNVQVSACRLGLGSAWLDRRTKIKCATFVATCKSGPKCLMSKSRSARDQFDGLIAQLKQEHDSKVESLKAELDAVKLLMGFEHRRLSNVTPSAQPQPQASRSQTQSAPPLVEK